MIQIVPRAARGLLPFPPVTMRRRLDRHHAHENFLRNPRQREAASLNFACIKTKVNEGGRISLPFPFSSPDAPPPLPPLYSSRRRNTQPDGEKVGKRTARLSFLALTLNVTVEQMILKSNDYTHLLARGGSPPPESVVLLFHGKVITRHSRWVSTHLQPIQQI